MTVETQEVNGTTYVIEKLLHSVDGHDQKVKASQLVASPKPIEHKHILAVQYNGKFQVLVGIIPDTDKEITIKVASKYSLKRAIYVSPEELAKAEAEARAAQAPQEFRNRPRISDHKTQRDWGGNRQTKPTNRYA